MMLFFAIKTLAGRTGRFRLFILLYLNDNNTHATLKALPVKGCGIVHKNKCTIPDNRTLISYTGG